MRDQYLLPCECGEKVKVEAILAGQEVRCQCGAALDVPNMQGLRRLERIMPESSEKPSSPLGAAAGIGLIGLVIFAVGATFTGITLSQRPILMPLEHVTPWESWMMWQDVSSGVRAPDFMDIPYLIAMKKYRQKRNLSIAVTVFGAIVLLGGVTGSVAQRRSKPNAPPG